MAVLEATQRLRFELPLDPDLNRPDYWATQDLADREAELAMPHAPRSGPSADPRKPQEPAAAKQGPAAAAQVSGVVAAECAGLVLAARHSGDLSRLRDATRMAAALARGKAARWRLYPELSVAVRYAQGLLAAAVVQPRWEVACGAQQLVAPLTRTCRDCARFRRLTSEASVARSLWLASAASRAARRRVLATVVCAALARSRSVSCEYQQQIQGRQRLLESLAAAAAESEALLRARTAAAEHRQRIWAARESAGVLRGRKVLREHRERTEQAARAVHECHGLLTSSKCAREHRGELAARNEAAVVCAGESFVSSNLTRRTFFGAAKVQTQLGCRFCQFVPSRVEFCLHQN